MPEIDNPGLHAFGAEVIELLEITPERDSDTLDQIGMLAIRHGLAHSDHYGMFTRGLKHCPVSSV